MVDSALYDDYDISWWDLLNFDIKSVKNHKNPILQLTGMFNQLIKRGDFRTIIEIVHNIDHPSPYRILDLFRRLYPGNNIDRRSQMGKDFILDGQSRLNKMIGRTRGNNEPKCATYTQKEFMDIHFNKRLNHIKTKGYAVFGKIVYVPSGTWANAIRARGIVENDLNTGMLVADNVKWVYLEYGDTFQVASIGNVNKFDDSDFPVDNNGNVMDSLKTYMDYLKGIMETEYCFSNAKSVSGGHKGIGTISNIGSSRFTYHDFMPEKYKLFDDMKYQLIVRNYIFNDLSGIKWDLHFPHWKNEDNNTPLSFPPKNSRVMEINQIRLVNKTTGELYIPNNYQPKLDIGDAIKLEKAKKMMANEEKELDTQVGIIKALKKHEKYKV